MGVWSNALAPVVAFALKSILTVLISVGTVVLIYRFVPKPVQDWAFGLLDKYLPVIAGWIK